MNRGKFYCFILCFMVNERERKSKMRDGGEQSMGKRAENIAKAIFWLQAFVFMACDGGEKNKKIAKCQLKPHGQTNNVSSLLLFNPSLTLVE